MADWMAVSGDRGGLGLGAGGVSLILAAVVFLLIRRPAKTRMDVRVEEVGLDGSDVGGLGRGRALGLDLG
ncbi:MAG TPA: hypothetical protein VHA80_01495 [Solirubrobacterales bacterium]|nr:hypothetical protein [Solirubrobacterales bacterium]